MTDYIKLTKDLLHANQAEAAEVMLDLFTENSDLKETVDALNKRCEELERTLREERHARTKVQFQGEHLTISELCHRIEILQKKANRNWVSVKKSLPDISDIPDGDGIFVIACEKHDDFWCYVPCVYNEFGFNLYKPTRINPEKITHWMPLPEPPGKG